MSFLNAFLVILLVAFSGKATVMHSAEVDLLKAAETGDVLGVKQALDAGADVDATDLYDRTALIRASAKGHLEVVRFLLEKNPDLNAKALEVTHGSTSQVNDSALMNALQNERYEVARELIKAGSDLNLKDIRQRTALVYLIDNATSLKLKKNISKNHLLELSQLMVDHGADVNLGKRVKITIKKIKKGKDTKTISKTEIVSEIETPLMLAAEGGQAELVEYLLSQGADPRTSILDDENDEEETALSLAREAQKNPENSKCRPTKTKAVDYCDYKKTIELLKNQLRKIKNSEVKPSDSKERLADRQLLRAIERKDLQALQKALQEGANVNAYNDEDESALLLAIGQNFTAGVELLIKSKAAPNLKSIRSQTPLMMAIIKDDVQITKLVLSHPKLNPDLKDLQFKSPLIHLIDDVNKEGERTSEMTRLEQYQLVQQLIQKGADAEYGVKTRPIKKGSSRTVRFSAVYTGLIAAADLGNADLVEFFLRAPNGQGGFLGDPNVLLDDKSFEVYGRALEIAEYVSQQKSSQKNCSPGIRVSSSVSSLTIKENQQQLIKAYCDYPKVLAILKKVTKGKAPVTSTEDLEE